MRKSICLVAALALLCGTSWAAKETAVAANELDYWSKVNATELTVFIPEGEVGDAWGRAQSWVGKYSSMKVQIATDYIIQTFNPTYWPQYGYYLTKEPKEGGADISVECIALWGIFSRKAKDKNAHILAYYIQTGTLPDFAIKEIKK